MKGRGAGPISGRSAYCTLWNKLLYNYGPFCTTLLFSARCSTSLGQLEY